MGPTRASVVLNCRTCTRACKQFKSLQDEIQIGEEGSITIANLLNYCFNISFELQDAIPSMPQHICQHCLQLAEQAFNFKRRIIESDELLRLGYEKRVVEASKDNNNEADNPIVCEQEVLPAQEELNIQFEEAKEAEETMNMLNYYQTAEFWANTSPVEDVNDIQLISLEMPDDQLAPSSSNAEANNNQDNGYFITLCNDDSANDFCVDDLIEECDSQMTVSPAPPGNEVLKYACNVCHKSFRQRCRLNQHQQTHNNEKQHACEVCGKKIKHLRNYKLHLETHTNTDKTHECSVCGKFYRTPASLKVHMRSHSACKSYKCEQCARSFSVMDHLTRHKLTHTGERPYACNLCDKAYYDSSSLRQHLVRHTGVKPFKCEICGASLSQKSGYKKHLLVHAGVKPHKCHICAREFTFVSNFNSHVHLHSGDKPFRCDKCPKTFPTKKRLQSHMKVHNKNVLITTITTKDNQAYGSNILGG